MTPPRFVVATRESENELLAALRKAKGGINHATGKGEAAERAIVEHLLVPYLPPPYLSRKGSVTEAPRPQYQSPQMDAVIYDPSAAPPLIDDEGHSVFPIEAVAGVMQMTLALDGSKLRADLAAMLNVREMRTRGYWIPAGGSTTRIVPFTKNDCMGCRCFVVGLADDAWAPDAIARTLREAQIGTGMHVHGLYVVGSGFFETIAAEGGIPSTAFGRGQAKIAFFAFLLPCVRRSNGGHVCRLNGRRIWIHTSARPHLSWSNNLIGRQGCLGTAVRVATASRVGVPVIAH